MRKLLSLILALAAFTVWGQETYTTFGTDFWLAYMTNWYPDDVDTFYVSVSGPRNCTCTISNPNSGWSNTLSVSADSVTTYKIPNAQCNPNGSCIVNNAGLHITATDSVQVFAFNHSGSASTSDATILYTTESLGPEYIVQTYPITTSSRLSQSQFSILAVQDNTVVDIILSGATSTGIAAGTTHTVTLNAGQVYQVQSPSTNGDFSGTIVTTENHGCTHFALFMGNTLANIPTSNTISSDHTYSQALPTRAWAKEWLLTPPLWYDNAVVRVTAKADNTQVRVGSSVVATLQRGQTHEFTLSSPQHLTTTNPCQVLQYFKSRYNGYGDASAFVPNALNCKTKSTVFPSFPQNSRGSYQSRYYVNIVFPLSDANLIRFDNNPVSSTAISGTNYRYVIITTTSASHTITTTGAGFMAYAYGLGENWESYVMPLGGIGPILPQIDTMVATTCTYPFVFRDQLLTQDGEYLFVKSCYDTTRLFLSFLDIDTTTLDTFSCGSSFVWLDSTYIASGQYYQVSGRDRRGCDSLIQLNLVLSPTYDTTIHIVSCDPLFTYDDTTVFLTDSITHLTLRRQTQQGCDSIVHLDVELADLLTELYDGSCDPQYAYADTLLSVPGDYTFIFTNDLGCDSTVQLHLQQYPSYYYFTEDTIYKGQEYAWVNDLTFDDSTNLNLHYTTVNGCDSNYHLILHAIEPSSLHIWVPNIFTPNQSENRTFRVYSEGLDQLTVSVFQRWGDHVCTFDGLTESWDGTYHGRPCPQATYVYYIRYHIQGSNEIPMPITGTVTLLR